MAERWNERWPDDAKVGRNFDLWENHGTPDGYPPSRSVLTRLAELYECTAADLGFPDDQDTAA